MQAEATLVWSYMAGPLKSHVCVLKRLVYLIQHYILKIHLYCSKLFSVSVSPPPPVRIHACGRGAGGGGVPMWCVLLYGGQRLALYFQ